MCTSVAKRSLWCQYFQCCACALSMGRDSQSFPCANITKFPVTISTGMHVEVAVAKQTVHSLCQSSLRRAEVDWCTGLAASDAEASGSGPNPANQADLISVGACLSLLHG